MFIGLRCTVKERHKKGTNVCIVYRMSKRSCNSDLVAKNVQQPSNIESGMCCKPAHAETKYNCSQSCMMLQVAFVFVIVVELVVLTFRLGSLSFLVSCASGMLFEPNSLSMFYKKTSRFLTNKHTHQFSHAISYPTGSSPFRILLDRLKNI